MKNIIQTLLLLFITNVSAQSQNNDIITVMLSRESDYEYGYRPRTREQILMDFQDSIVYYRIKSNRKFKTCTVPINTFFKDSINYQKLDDLIIGMSNETESNCCFRNKGSIIITIIKGDSYRNYSESFEFGSVISCIDEDQFLILKKIQEEFFKMENLVFN